MPSTTEQLPRGTPELTPKWPRTFRSLRHRNYLYFWIGQILSLIGTWMQIVAQGWLVYRLTDSVFMLGLVNLIGLLPVVPITLISGVISDRYSRRKVILVAETIMMIQALLFALLTWLGVINIWHVILLSFLLGSAAALEQPVRLAIIVDLVGKEDLTNAVALNSAVYNIARIVGPVAAGFFVAFWGEAGCFLINGISFGGVILALFFMKLPEGRISRAEIQIVSKLSEGLKYIWKDREIRSLMGVVAYASFLTLPYVTLLPAFSKDILQVGPDGLGVLMTGIGVGALFGALLIAGVRSGRRGKWLTIANILAPVFLVIFTISKSFWWSVGLLVFLGGWNAVRQSMANSLIQLSTKDEFHGRVMSIFNLIFNGMSRAGAVVLGGLAEFVGISWMLGIGGILSLALSIFVAWRFSYIYKMP